MFTGGGGVPIAITPRIRLTDSGHVRGLERFFVGHMLYTAYAIGSNVDQYKNVWEKNIIIMSRGPLSLSVPHWGPSPEVKTYYYILINVGT